MHPHILHRKQNRILQKKGINSDFISPAPKLCYNVTGQKSGIAAGHIDVNIAYAKQAVQYLFKSGHKLYFI